MEQKLIAVDPKNPKVVFAIPAKLKPPKPWYVRKFGALLQLN
jgi:hypothetical protein